MVYVFDASFVGAIIIPDERDPYVEKIYTKIKKEDEKYAPHLFWYEISNVFKNLLRRKRYTFDDVLGFFRPLAAIHLTCDCETGTGYANELLRLCNDYNISSYDAAYLELAWRKKAALCTMDDNLAIAAKKHGVAVLNR
jgi:predicted nucleic acid-binding protein